MQSAAVQPELRALDAYNPMEELVAWVRSFGVTTIHTGHAPGAVVSGQTMIVKTRGSAYPKLEAWLLEHHPYDVPEVLALPIAHGAPAYLEWLNAETLRG